MGWAGWGGGGILYRKFKIILSKGNIVLKIEHLRAPSLVVTDLRSETKGYRFEADC